MTNEQINAAIAEACGWKNITRSASNGWLHRRLIGTNQQMKVTFDVHTPIPDFSTDLNAMYEAEKVLTFKDWELYCDELGGSLRGCAHATARQRARAFLETFGLWDNGSA